MRCRWSRRELLRGRIRCRRGLCRWCCWSAWSREVSREHSVFPLSREVGTGIGDSLTVCGYDHVHAFGLVDHSYSHGIYPREEHVEGQRCSENMKIRLNGCESLVHRSGMPSLTASCHAQPHPHNLWPPRKRPYPTTPCHASVHSTS